jgi:hypothetical protein
MAASPVHEPAEGDDDPAPTPDPMSAEEWEAWLDHQDEPFRSGGIPRSGRAAAAG